MVSQKPYLPDVPRITPAQTEQLLSEGKAIVVDVRSPDLFASGHIPGALSAPLNRLRALLPRLPRDKVIVFY